MLLKNDLDYFPIDHALMKLKDNYNPEMDSLVTEYLIVKFLVFFLDSSVHRINLDELERRIIYKPEANDLEDVREIDVLL